MAKKILFNFHSHTNFSDGNTVFADLIFEAIEQGFISIGFSEHSPVPFHSTWNMNAEKIHQYFFLINQFKKEFSNTLQIYVGMEVDYFEPYANQILTLSHVNQLDYFIGSVHYLDFLDDKPWCIDTSFEEFNEGFSKLFRNSGEMLYTKYYDAITQMIEKYRPNIIGHLDKIKMYNHVLNVFAEDEKKYRFCVIQVLDLMKRFDIMLEINMRGFYKHPQKYIYPSIWIIKEAVLRNIPIVVSSDCHQQNELSTGFDYASEILVTLGVNCVWYLHDNNWKSYSLI